MAFAALLYLGRSLTFYHDEWTFIVERRELTLDSLMRPHNEHWSLFLVLFYTVMLSLIGLASYLPYLAALLVLHVVVAGGVFRLAEREADGWVALGAATLILFLGSGSQNLFWAFQIGFVGATAAGIWALVALRPQEGRSSLIAAAVLLTVAVATQGIGLFFLVAAAALIMTDGTWRWRWPAVAIPAIAYLTWFGLVGRGDVSHHRDPFTMDALASVPGYLLRGLEWSFGSITGWGPDVGRVLLVVAVLGVLAAAARGRHVPALTLAGTAGVLSQYAVTGLVRAQLGADQATEARYTYVAAAFLLPAAAAALGAWMTGRRVPLRHAMALLPLLAVALVVNGYALLPGKANFQQNTDFTRAYVEVVQAHHASPALLASQGIFPHPAPAELLRLIARDGSPGTDRWLPSVVRPTTPELRDRALTGMLAADFRIEPGDQRAGTPIEVAAAQHVAWAMRGESCIDLQAVGAQPSLTLRVSAADDLGVHAGAGGMMSIALGFEATPQAPIGSAAIDAGSAYVVRLPDLESSASWLVRVDLPPVRASASVCSVGPQG